MMRVLRLLTVLCMTGTVGCFPAITHGARVENGASFGVTATTTSGATHTEGDEGGIYLRQGIIGAYGGYGWAPSSRTSPGFYLGVAIPVAFPATQIDAYLQAPPAWTGPLQAGIGAAVDYEAAHAYAMLGKQDERGKGWSVHAGYGQRASISDFQGASPAFVFGGALHFPFSSHGRAQAYVQAAQGRDPEPCFSDPPGATTRSCTPGRSSHSVTVGASLGWHQ